MFGPVSVALREVSRNPGHTRVQVFVGRTPGSRGMSGTLVLRTDEWDELAAMIEFPEVQDTGQLLALDDVLEVLPPLESELQNYVE